MPKIDVKEELANRFAQPLPPCQQRRVVVWHDAEGEFEQTFADLSEHGFDAQLAERLPRPVRCVEAADGHMFEVTRLINRGDTTSDILLYRKQPRGVLGGDWLADVELYADQFQADYLSLLADELGAVDAPEVRDALQRHKAFFAAKGRVAKFGKCVPCPRSAADVEIGMLAVIFGGSDPSSASMPFIVRSCLVTLLHDGPEGLSTLFDTYDATESLALFIKQRTGYAGSLYGRDALKDLASHVLLTATSLVVPVNQLRGLDAHISAAYAQYCMTAVREWARDKGTVDDLHEIVRLVEDTCGLRGVFIRMPLESLLPLDVFPCVDEVLLDDLFASFAAGADRIDDARRVITARRDLCWYESVACHYDALAALTDMAAFKRDHANGFHIAQAAKVWEAYTTDWWHMDRAYRSLQAAYGRCKLSMVDALEDAERKALKWAENLYVNWFLIESNACWANAAQDAWKDAGYVEGVERQDLFYWETLSSFSGSAKTKVVLISDALRYEVAQDVADALERERGGSVRRGTMQAVFPSITEMGMPALLPHQTMTLDAQNDDVTVDGMPTVTTAQRETALQKVAPTGRALRAEAYLDMSSTERKELLKSSEIVYLYHNKIDATGEKSATQDDVFDACRETVDELVSIAKRVCLDAPSARVVITADHGFIYTAHELRECQFLGKRDLPDDPVLFGKRHAVLPSGDSLVQDAGADEASPLLTVDMDRFVRTPCVGLAPREIVHFKRPGGTRRYVHGGVSLQELVVPVVGYRRLSASSKEFVDIRSAELKVLSESRRVTNTLFAVSLVQTEAAEGKVLPCEYELVFTDATGNEVSDVVRAHADMTSENQQDRVLEVRFALKAGVTFRSSELYQLVCRDAASGAIVWQEPYKIDVSFAPVIDFGF